MQSHQGLWKSLSSSEFLAVFWLAVRILSSWVSVVSLFCWGESFTVHGVRKSAKSPFQSTRKWNGQICTAV